MYTINWNTMTNGPGPEPHSPPPHVHLFTPQKSHSFTNPYIVVVEVAETRKRDCRQEEEAGSGQLDFSISVNVVRHDLAQTPVPVQSERCSQGVVHDRAWIEIGNRTQSKESYTQDSLSGPVQGGSFGPSPGVVGRCGMYLCCAEVRIILVLFTCSHRSD